MISPQAQETLKTLKTSAYGRALTELLAEHLAKLDDVSTLTSWEEAQGRQHGKKLIKDIFIFLETKKETENTKNQYE